MPLDLGTLVVKLKVDDAEFQASLREAPKEAAAAGSGSGKKFGDEFASQVQPKTQAAISKGTSGPATAKAGRASGQKFGTAFLAGVSAIMGALDIAKTFGTEIQAQADKLKLSLQGTVESLNDLGKNGSATKLDAEFAKISGGVQDTGLAVESMVQISKSSGGTFLASLTTWGAGLIGLKSSYASTKEQVDKVDQALASMDTQSAAAAYTNLAAQLTKYGVSQADVVAQFPQYQATLQQMANELHVTGLTAREWADWMGGKLPAAVVDAANAQPELAKKLGITTSAMVAATNATNDSTGAADKNATASSKAASALQTWLDKISQQANRLLGLSGSQMSFQSAVDDATDSVKKNGRTLDIGTEKGRANRAALNDIASAAIELAQSMKEAGKPASTINAQMGRSRDAFIKAATSMGMAKDKAVELADKLGLLKTKTITVTTKYKTIGALNAAQRRAGAQVARATGGKIPGVASGDRDDKVPLLATPDEWVIQRPAARYYGDALMAALNAGSIPREMLTMRPTTRATGGKIGSAIVGDTVPVPMQRPAQRQTTLNVNVTNQYPQAEPTSITVNRALQSAAALGMI